MVRKNGYNEVKDGRGEVYEIVQLLRINDFIVKRDGKAFLLRTNLNRWREERLTQAELMKKFGPGTTEYRLLRKHPRAKYIPSLANKDLV